jgi:hypothetical protein
MKAGNAQVTSGNQPSGRVVPGSKDTALLLADSLLTLFLIFRTEASLAVSSLPRFITLNLLLVPLRILAWISLGVLVACGVYALTESIVLAAAAFFLLQAGALLLLEHRLRRLHALLTFPVSREGLASMRESWQQRFQHDDDPR